MSRASGFSLKYFSFTVLATLLLLLFGSGCRHFNDDTAQKTVTLQGTYLGSGNLGSGPMNLALTINGPDSLGRYDGIIYYHLVNTDLSSVTMDSTRDTLRIEYTRDNVSYHAWSITGTNSLLLHFTQPANISDVRVNRELEGYNLSGYWSGAMSSTGLQIQNNALMTMDEQGQLFSGQISTSLFQTYLFQINAGTLSRSAIQLSGTLRLNSVDYPGYFLGNFVNADSITGTWQIGQSSIVDEGYFIFSRSYN